MNPKTLSPLMQSLYVGDRVLNETVMFLEKGRTKTLLYDIVSIESVTSYGGEIVYEAEKDYQVIDGKLYLPKTSAIPVITEKAYYGVAESLIQAAYHGENVNIHWGEGKAMTDWQICVTYRHSGVGAKNMVKCENERFSALLTKLERGEDITILFCGDSITYGASASWIYSYPPYQPSYPMLFTQSLADLFGYTIRYIDPGLVCNGVGIAPVPKEDYVGGENGRITYINTAIGGWNSLHGVENAKAHIEDQIDAHGCDLFVVALGMNDPFFAPEETSANVGTIIEKVLSHAPSASTLVVSTMMPNPTATNGWYGNQQYQEDALSTLVQTLVQKDISAALVPVGSQSKAILARKEFMDYTGNNINHPSDFFSRVYAQALLEVLIGYENLA